MRQLELHAQIATSACPAIVDTIQQLLSRFAKIMPEAPAALLPAARPVIARGAPPAIPTTASVQFQTARFVRIPFNVTTIVTQFTSQKQPRKRTSAQLGIWVINMVMAR